MYFIGDDTSVGSLIQHVVGEIANVSNRTLVQRRIQSYAERCGFSAVWCCVLPMDLDDAGPTVLMDTRPTGWSTLYHDEDLIRHDPCFREAGRLDRPFTWGELRAKRKLSFREARVLETAAQFGLHDAFVVPIYEPNGNVGLISFLGPGRTLSPAERADLTLVAVFIFNKLSALQRRRRPISLTDRERQIVTWLAEGKSDWQIGQILDISSKTVNYHVENLKRKFGVASRIQAVVAALRKGNLAQG